MNNKFYITKENTNFDKFNIFSNYKNSKRFKNIFKKCSLSTIQNPLTEGTDGFITNGLMDDIKVEVRQKEGNYFINFYDFKVDLMGDLIHKKTHQLAHMSFHFIPGNTPEENSSTHHFKLDPLGANILGLPTVPMRKHDTPLLQRLYGQDLLLRLNRTKGKINFIDDVHEHISTDVYLIPIPKNSDAYNLYLEIIPALEDIFNNNLLNKRYLQLNNRNLQLNKYNVSLVTRKRKNRVTKLRSKKTKRKRIN